MWPPWVLSAPDGPHVGPINLAIWVVTKSAYPLETIYNYCLTSFTVIEDCAKLMETMLIMLHQTHDIFVAGKNLLAETHAASN